MNRKSQLGTLAIVIAGLFGMLTADFNADEEDNNNDIIVSNAGRKHRRIVARDFKLFEFMPADGLGAGSACPYPNWLLQSEQLNTSWVAGFGGSSAPIITVDQTADPVTGAITADRVQFPAGTGGTWSSVYQTGIGCFNVGCTFAFKIKGNGSSGIMDIAIGTGTPTNWTTCNYIDGVWSTCSITAYGSSVWFGNLTTWTGLVRSSHDVFVTRAQYTSSETIVEYSKTTTAATAPQPTTAKGESLSVARASTVYCNSNTDATSATGIKDSSLIRYPPHAIRVERGSDGILGVRGEHQITNNISPTEALDSLPWTTTGTAIIITPDYAIGPNGMLTADRLQIPATSGSGLSLRSFTGMSSIQHTGGCYVKGVGGSSGTLDIYQSGVDLTCGGCVYNGDTWTRCSRTSSTSVTTFQIGNDSLDCGGAARAAADVLITGCQSEPGPYLTSYVPSDVGSRYADILQYDLGPNAPPANNMCVKGALSGKPITAYDGYMGVVNVASDSMGGTSGKGMWLYSNATNGSTIRCIAMNDTSTLFAASSVAGGSGNVSGYCDISGNTVVGSWSGNNMTASGAISGTFSPARYITLSGQSLGNFDAIKSRIVVDFAGRCN